MALVTQTPLLALATARDLETLGIAQVALRALTLAQRLRGLRAATGRLITPIRKRYPTPLLPTLDLATVDGSGMLGGATWTWDLGPASLVQDYLITFAAGPTYTVTPNAGAFGTVAGPSFPLVAQTIAIDGYKIVFTGTINPGDAFAYSTSIVQDPGIALAVTQLCSFILLHNRGVDPLTLADLKSARDDAMAWAAALGIPGEGELDKSLDTDLVDGGTYGPLGTGQTSADEWLYGPSGITPPIH